METEEKQDNRYRRFMDKNQVKIKAKHICEVCFGTYTYFNRSRHNNSKKHMMVMNHYVLKENKE